MALVNLGNLGGGSGDIMSQIINWKMQQAMLKDIGGFGGSDSAGTSVSAVLAYKSAKDFKAICATAAVDLAAATDAATIIAALAPFFAGIASYLGTEETAGLVELTQGGGNSSTLAIALAG